jgi:hypothetical protein
MKNEGNSAGKVILFSVIFLIVGGVAGYFIGAHSSNYNNDLGYGDGNFSNGNFQLNDTVREEINSFFDNSPTTVEVNAYCQNNPRYCMEYCRTINPSSEICSTLDVGSFRGGMPAK